MTERSPDFFKMIRASGITGEKKQKTPEPTPSRPDLDKMQNAAKVKPKNISKSIPEKPPVVPLKPEKRRKSNAIDAALNRAKEEKNAKQKTPENKKESTPDVEKWPEKSRIEREGKIEVEQKTETITKNWDDEDLPENFEADTWKTSVKAISGRYGDENRLVNLEGVGFAIPLEKFPQGKIDQDHEYKVVRAEIDDESKLIMISDETEIAAINNSSVSQFEKEREARKWQSNTETWGEKNKKELEKIRRSIGIEDQQKAA